MKQAKVWRCVVKTKKWGVTHRFNVIAETAEDAENLVRDHLSQSMLSHFEVDVAPKVMKDQFLY